MRLPILTGPLRGRWWLLESRGQPGRVLTGGYEPAHTRIFEALLRPGAQVIDVGAHVGYYSLLAAQLTGERGRVYAFEPDPRNCHHLRRHLRINGFESARAFECAIADREGSACFRTGTGSGTGHLASSGPLEVRIRTIDGVCADEGIRPDLIKIDAEGAEVRVLEGARETLTRDRPVLVLSTHGPEPHRGCIATLRSLDYSLSAITGESVDETSELLCVPA